ncbi:MAG: DUF4340 domain-containing protein [Candidatus Marinimicrobia bacterium]|nr:DUF4340 domain-containing protein [Candidatus Neomarinimicrobiota bacterium]
MGKNLKYGLIILGVLIVVYVLNTIGQNTYTSTTSSMFTGEIEDIAKFVINKNSDQLEIVKVDTTWQITDHDTLVIKKSSIDNLFNKVLKVKKGTILSTNPEKWNKYSVDDSTGTHLYLFNYADEELGHFVFGSSKADYSRNNLRIPEDNSVYQTDQNVVWNLSTRSSYWGQKPKPPEPETIQPN